MSDGRPDRRPRATPAADRPDDLPVTTATIEDWHFIDALRLLYKRRWTAIWTLIAVVAAVFVYVSTAPAVYEATTRMLIEQEQPQVIVFQEAFDPSTQSAESKESHETQLRILQSRSLARQVLDALNLWEHREFGAPDEPGASNWHDRIASALRRVAGWLPGPLRPAAAVSASEGEARGPDELPTQAQVVDAFLAKLVISPVASTLLVDVKFRTEDPKLAADVANSLAQLYMDQDQQFRFERSQQASEWLSKQLEAQRGQTEMSEAALQQYRERTDAISSTQRENLGTQEMSAMNSAYVRAKTDRIEKEALYHQARQLTDDPGALETFPAILSNSYIQSLRGDLADLERQLAELEARRLGRRHPQTVRVMSSITTTRSRLRAETDKALEALRLDYQAALALEKSLAGAFEDQKRDTVQEQRRETNYQMLERAALTDRQVFESLLQRVKQTGISNDQFGSHIRVIDPADVPRAPISPQKARSLILALVSGLVLAVGMAFFIEYFDDRISRPDDMATHFDLASLGLIPLLARKLRSGERPMLPGDTSRDFWEAFRVIRTNLLFADSRTSVRTLAVTSVGPGEGKTLVAANLSVSLALTGARVLLVDADLRRPSVHGCFGLSQEPGVSDVAMGKTSVSQAMQTTATAGLWVMPCGHDMDNPTELLSSGKFRQLVAAAARHFDWVIIDTPPVLAVADAAIVANLASGVLLVVAAEMTARRTVRTALLQLEAARARVIGTVLNRVNLKRNGFYYFDYYRPEYTRYYGSSRTPS